MIPGVTVAEASGARANRAKIEGAGRLNPPAGRLLTPEPCGTTGGVWIGAHNPSATLAKVQDREGDRNELKTRRAAWPGVRRRALFASSSLRPWVK
jgi:hypothetical protein